MAILNVNLSDKDASEVVSAALWAFEGAFDDDETKLQTLRGALADGEASGLADGDVMGEIMERLRKERLRKHSEAR